MLASAGVANALFIVGVIVFFALVLLAPGRGPFAARGTQGKRKRRWRTFSRHGFYDPAADKSDDDPGSLGH